MSFLSDEHLPDILREALEETDRVSLHQTIDRLVATGNVATLSKGLERLDKAVSTIQAKKILESTKDIRAAISNVITQVKKSVRK